MASGATRLFAFLHFANAKNQTPSSLHLIKSINTFIDYYIYIDSPPTHTFFACKNAKTQNYDWNYLIISYVEVCKTVCKCKRNAKVFSAKNCPFLCNTLNVSIMRHLSSLHEKRLYCARFARFFAQNTRFVHLFARFLHSYEKLVFPAFLAFLPLNLPLFGFNPAIFHILPTTLMQDKMQNRCKWLGERTGEKTSEKSVKIFTNPTSYRGIRKCPKTLPREEKSTASWGKKPNYAT